VATAIKLVPAESPTPASAASSIGRLEPLGERVLVIAPPGRALRIDVRELWAYRTLLYFLVWRDLKVRYTQTILGVGWAVAQPLLNTVVFTLVFGSLVHVPTDGVPYPIFALAGLVPWTFVATGFAAAGLSLLNSSNLITKVYFPRLVIPWAPVCAAGVDLAVGLALLVVGLAVFRQVPSAQALIVVPLSVLACALTAAGIGSWVSALSVQFRDVKHLVPFVSTLWMYASPIVYPLARVPRAARPWYCLNPVAGIIDGFRASLLGRQVAWGLWSESVAVAVVLFVSGAWYFRRTELVFADLV
jgi:lipopolysaccharide transport system permease protein